MVAPSSLDCFILPWPRIPRIRNWVPKAFSKSEMKMHHVSSSSSVLGLPQDKKLKDCLSLPRCLQIAESPPQLKPVPLADLGSADLLPAASPLPPSWVSSSFQLTGCDALIPSCCVMPGALHTFGVFVLLPAPFSSPDRVLYGLGVLHCRL